MAGRMQHIATDQLTALAFTVRAPEDRTSESTQDQLALTHVAECDECAARFATLVADADALRDAACAASDDVFDDALLDAQRTRILDRLAHLGQAARVLAFPHRPREATMPVSSSSRRWISGAAAAGLIIGLVAGQMLHFLPADKVLPRGDSSMQAVERSSRPAIVPASASYPMLSDDELMEEVERAIEARRAPSLRAIDAFTPTAGDLFALGR
jgi:anti-sigma factor RsiW